MHFTMFILTNFVVSVAEISDAMQTGIEIIYS